MNETIVTPNHGSHNARLNDQINIENLANFLHLPVSAVAMFLAAIIILLVLLSIFFYIKGKMSPKKAIPSVMEAEERKADAYKDMERIAKEVIDKRDKAAEIENNKTSKVKISGNADTDSITVSKELQMEADSATVDQKTASRSGLHVVPDKETLVSGHAADAVTQGSADVAGQRSNMPRQAGYRQAQPMMPIQQADARKLMRIPDPAYGAPRFQNRMPYPKAMAQAMPANRNGMKARPVQRTDTRPKQVGNTMPYNNNAASLTLRNNMPGNATAGAYNGAVQQGTNFLDDPYLTQIYPVQQTIDNIQDILDDHPDIVTEHDFEFEGFVEIELVEDTGNNDVSDTSGVIETKDMFTKEDRYIIAATQAAGTFGTQFDTNFSPILEK